MRFGVNTCLWFAEPTTARLRDAVARARGAGADWLEFPVYADTRDVDLGAVRSMLERETMGVSVVTALWPNENLIDDDDIKSRAGVTALRTTIEMAAELGAKRLAGAFYAGVNYLEWHAPERRAQLIERLCERLAELAAFAARHDVVLCIEPINRYETSLLNTAAQALEVLRRVNHANCGLLLDTFHMNIEEASVVDAIRGAGHWLKHFHANESHRGVPGTGAIDWTNVHDSLCAVAYDGAVVIECGDYWNPDIAKGGGVWRPMAPSADDLARDGLRFLRNALSE
jgi:D-psicose/D-tagatose/L-ribulose 3-epimerase